MSQTEGASSQRLCGMCNKPVSSHYTKEEFAYKRNCPLCQVEHYHCMPCVKKYVSGYDGRKKNTNVSIESFKSSKIDYYCHSCEDVECPSCTKKHSRCKSIIGSLFYF